MIEVRCAGGDGTRGAGLPLTVEQATKIAMAEPPAARGSAPGLPVFVSPDPPPVEKPEPKQQPLF
jgi:hypothetical protein